MYKNALVIGKFLPLHNGHLALIRFALAKCNKVTIVLCVSTQEEAAMPLQITGALRLNWLRETFIDEPNVTIVYLPYDEDDLPNSSVSSGEIAKVWAAQFITMQLGVDVVVASEAYAHFVAKEMAIAALVFDEKRLNIPISATMIRQNPLQYWVYLPPAVRPHFVLKICICGTESTGKSTLCALLAEYFDTVFVQEAAREVVTTTDTCTFEDLSTIVALHTQHIVKQSKISNGLVFLDTDCITTASYSQFLFQKKLPIAPDILAMNAADLYLYLSAEAPFVQDGTRLSFAERSLLDQNHRHFYEFYGKKIHIIAGDYAMRLNSAIALIHGYLERGSISATI